MPVHAYKRRTHRSIRTGTENPTQYNLRRILRLVRYCKKSPDRCESTLDQSVPATFSRAPVRECCCMAMNRIRIRSANPAPPTPCGDDDHVTSGQQHNSLPKTVLSLSPEDRTSRPRLQVAGAIRFTWMPVTVRNLVPKSALQTSIQQA